MIQTASGRHRHAGLIFWRGVAKGAFSGYALEVLDQLLLVLVLVEILHTVRMSIRSAVPDRGADCLGPPGTGDYDATAQLTGEGHSTADATVAFRNSMIELGLLGFLALVFVVSINFLRRGSTREELVKEI